MAKPKPWSHTALDAFVNCPFAYHQKYVLKNVVVTETPEMTWGKRVHKDLELRITEGKKLPLDLQEHEPFMAQLEGIGGVLNAEEKIALNTKLEPCGQWDADVFYRGVVDASVVTNDRALIIDYKTGKPHNKPQQLITFALWTFAKYHFVNKVMASYYWTKTKDDTTFKYTREQVPELWDTLVPNLKQYKEAFKTDVWQKRPSGLCNGWCDVDKKHCEHWRPKRAR